MRTELAPLRRPLGLEPAPSGPLALLRGRRGGIEIVAAISGIGTRRAARTAHRLLDAGAVDHLVLVGVAGGIGAGVGIGDLVVPDRVLDLATGREHRPAPWPGSTPSGVLATSDALITDPARAAALAARGVVAVDMETAAVAAACEARGCPWSVLRGVSDRADDGTTDAAILGLASPEGGTDVSALLRFVARRPRRVSQLLRLARGLFRARRAAALALLRGLDEDAADAPGRTAP